MPHPDIKSAETSFMDKCNIYVQLQHVSSRQKVRFYGIITQFSDAYAANWVADSVYGRSDPIATYQNTTRTISVGFTVISENDDVGELNMRDLSKLVNIMYPTYDGVDNRAGSIAAGPLLKFKFNNLATNAASEKIGVGAGVQEDGLVGYINGGVTVNHVVDAGYLTPKPGILVPREVSLTFTFTVLHTHNLGWTVDGRSRTNGLYPYKTGGAFTPLTANSNSNSTRFTDPGTAATNPSSVQASSRDEIPEEIQRSRNSSVSNNEQTGGELNFSEEEGTVINTNDAVQGRQDASSEISSTSPLTREERETYTKEMEEHYDDMIGPASTTQ